MPKTNNKVDIDPEDIFRKSEDEMSDIEKMMADILNDYKEDTKNIPSKQSPSEEPEQVYVSPAPPVRKKRTPDTAPQASASDTAPSARSTSRSSSRAAKRAPVQDAPASSAVETRSRKKEREKNIEQAAKKRSAAPLIAAFVIIAILVVGALVYTKMFEDLRTQRIAAQSASATPAPAAQSGSADDAAASDHTEATPEVTFPPDMIFPTPEPDDVLASGDVRIQPPAGSIVLMSDTVPTPAPAGEASSADAASETDASSSSAAASESAAQPAEHTYQFFREDKSWTEAQQACRDKGGYLAVVGAAFVGSLLIMALLLLFSSLLKNNLMLLITGIMMGYITSSVISLLNFLASVENIQSFLIWGMGNFNSVSMQQMPIFATLCLLELFLALLLMKPLNAILLGESYATNLGIDIQRTRHLLLLATGLLTAVITAYCGPVAFLGLATPHVAFLLLGTSNHRVLLPVTMLTGAVLALLCNLLCTLPPTTIIPLNAVTPILGAPVILYIILRRR